MKEAEDLTQSVMLDRIGSVAVLTLNRPQRHNSLVPGFLRAMLDAVQTVAADGAVQAMVLQASGRSFSTGGDVRAFYEHLDDIESYSYEVVGLLNQVMLALIDLPVPLIAAVHGIVTGGSIGLVLAADEVLVSPSASFTPYYSQVGFSPDGGWTAILPEVIGSKRTAAVLLHNRTISAEQAVGWGLASQLVVAAPIRQAALEAAQSMAGMKPGSLSRTRKLLARRKEMAARLEEERQQFVQQIITDEARDGMKAFLRIPEGPA